MRDVNTEDHRSRKLVKRFGTVSSATLISRLLGYIRDAMVAHMFGGGNLTDAFYAAFRVPNLFRRLLGEGPLTTAFIPVFTEKLHSEKKEDAEEFFKVVFSTLAFVLVCLVVAGIVFAPTLTKLIAWGFQTSPDKFDLTVQLTRLLFPFLLFVSLAAISSGALNALGRFFLPSVAPAMLSVAEISFILLLMFGLFPSISESGAVQGLALSAAVGGFLHFFILVPLLRKEKMSPGWRWNPTHPGVLKVGWLVLPAVVGLSVDQINAFFDTICASFLTEGSVTALYNSNRLMQFPLALFGIAVSTAVMPQLSRNVAERDFEELKKNINLSIRLVLFTVLPAMVGLIVLGIPIITILFEHGRFTARETLLTNSAMAAYCLGLPAFSGVKILVNTFYALQDTKTPVRVATFCLLINMIGNLALMWRWGVGGLALATTLASMANAAVLFVLLRKRLGLMGGRRIMTTLLKSMTASVVMGIAAVSMIKWFGFTLYLRVPLAVITGMSVYVLFAYWLKMEERRPFLELILRRPAAAEAP